MGMGINKGINIYGSNAENFFNGFLLRLGALEISEFYFKY